MQRTAVKSSNVEAVGFDPASRILEVQFKGGAVYQYLDVPAEEHRKLMAAESIGSYLHQSIKGRFAFRKIGAKE